MKKLIIIVITFLCGVYFCYAKDPESAQAKWQEAEGLRGEHKLDVAEAALKEIIKSAPEFSSAYISLAEIKYIRLDFKGAINLASEVIARGENKAGQDNLVKAHIIIAASYLVAPAVTGGNIDKA